METVNGRETELPVVVVDATALDYDVVTWAVSERPAFSAALVAHFDFELSK